MADSDGEVARLAGGGGWIDCVAVVRWGDGLVEVFQQHGEGGVLDLEFGLGESASFLGRPAAVVFWGDDFLGEAEELQGSLDLTWEI